MNTRFETPAMAEPETGGDGSPGAGPPIGPRIGVVGAGAFGTALAQTARRGGAEPLIWAHEAETVQAINDTASNPGFLPGVPLDPGVRATADLAQLADRELVLMVPPAQHMRRLAEALADQLPASVPLVLCSKGMEAKTAKLMSEVVAEAAPGHPVAVLSGPNFAAELARGLPSAATLAAGDPGLCRRIIARLGLATFRLYASGDVVGAQIGSVVKNVMAIATGIVHGLELGENARAALLTRGLAEMTRFGLARGAERETLMGLSGLGDLMLTCSSLQSRNMSLGYEIGRGGDAATVLAGRRSVAEGAITAQVLAAEAERLGVDMPITRTVDAVLNRGLSLDRAVADLLTRPFKAEET
ncbi:NAD(P)H-dependent glycerol-3-phosphate dehydrogenase [Rhodothalassium salexigens]|uniref:NAD(P)H-dependent glycerol-3-phosphate dehydrogenase n=1 Tax=Rhodothalassium salexigens TaxID=1086 RepID=UPI0019134CA2|nr:NAD(P)H-dependent glycerol-3-phosphate dehydrogenase [Rhodothalassium salexigens]